jgi:hypothetical protein
MISWAAILWSTKLALLVKVAEAVADLAAVAAAVVTAAVEAAEAEEAVVVAEAAEAVGVTAVIAAEGAATVVGNRSSQNQHPIQETGKPRRLPVFHFQQVFSRAFHAAFLNSKATLITADKL